MNHTWINALIKALTGRSKNERRLRVAVETCEKAIRIYLETLYDDKKGHVSRRIPSDHIDQAKDEALFLAQNGDEGLGLGGRQDIYTKLKYWRGQFSISKGDSNDETHAAWEAEIGKRFKQAGLPFGYNYPREK